MFKPRNYGRGACFTDVQQFWHLPHAFLRKSSKEVILHVDVTLRVISISASNTNLRRVKQPQPPNLNTRSLIHSTFTLYALLHPGRSTADTSGPVDGRSVGRTPAKYASHSRLLPSRKTRECE